MKEKKKVFVPELEPITCTATTVFKLKDRLNLSNALELEIVNGVVVNVKLLNRAEDLPNSVIAKCTKRLWEVMRDQNQETIFGLKAGGATVVKKD